MLIPTMSRSVNANLGMEHELRIKESRILVVDDLTANVKLLENILHRLGYKQVRGETNPEEVKKIVAEWIPELLVLDLSMRGMDGYELLRRFREGVPKQDWIPILVLTADADPATKRKALAAGATEFLSKPLDPSELLWRIRSALLGRLYYAGLRDQNQVLEERVLDRTRMLSERTAELERAVSELQGAQKQIVQNERFRAFAEMAGGIAHDFNNVLQCMIGYTDILLQNQALLGEKTTVVQFLQTMNTAGLDASRIVSRLRNFYRPKDEAEVFTAVDLNRLIKEVVPLTQPKWQAQALASGRVIDVQFDLGELPPVPCNAADLRELLVNLVFNAVDAMPQGGNLTLQTKCCDRYATIGVSDTGIGMSDEVKQRCMEPFFSTKGENGTGLGLSMVFGIIRRHEGDVRIDSTPGVGTTFWISIPLVAEKVVIEDEETARVDTRLKILVVDDDPMPRDILVRYLEQDGHEVVGLGSGREALGRHTREKFNVVITDQAMPHITGVQLARAMRRVVPEQRVILVTGFEQENVPSDATADVDMVLKKPVSQNRLRKALAQVTVTECEEARMADRIVPVEFSR